MQAKHSVKLFYHNFLKKPKIHRFAYTSIDSPKMTFVTRTGLLLSLFDNSLMSDT